MSGINIEHVTIPWIIVRKDWFILKSVKLTLNR